MWSISYSSCWRDYLSTSELSMDLNGLSAKSGIFGLFLNSASSWVLGEYQWNLFQVWNGNFLYLGCHFIIRRWQRSSIVHRAFIRWSHIVLDTILKHCKWIMVLVTPLLNKSRHIKILKIITRTLDFRFLTLEIFLLIFFL